MTMRQWVLSMVGALTLLAMNGCGGGLGGLFGGGPAGDLRVRSLGDQPVALSGRFTHAVYANGDAVEWSFLLSDTSVEELAAGTVDHGRIVHVELLWIPRPGTTPIEVTATNASIRYVIIADGEVGVYGGAGFARPRGNPGDERLTLTLRDASLRLLHRTDGFADLLTPAQLSGTVTAELDSRAVRIMHHAVSQFVTDALGRSVIVQDRGRGGRATPSHTAVCTGPYTTIQSGSARRPGTPETFRNHSPALVAHPPD